MEFAVMNRHLAYKYAYTDHVETSAIISISSVDRDKPNLPIRRANGIKTILYLYFDDVESGPNAITHDDAKQIILFADNAAKMKVDRFIVHCEAGVSRSAGVCAAVKKYLGYDDDDIFDNPKYFPDMRCYRTVLDCGFQSGNVKQTEE